VPEQPRRFVYDVWRLEGRIESLSERRQDRTEQRQDAAAERKGW